LTDIGVLVLNVGVKIHSKEISQRSGAHVGGEVKVLVHDVLWVTNIASVVPESLAVRNRRKRGTALLVGGQEVSGVTVATSGLGGVGFAVGDSGGYSGALGQLKKVVLSASLASDSVAGPYFAVRNGGQGLLAHCDALVSLEEVGSVTLCTLPVGVVSHAVIHRGQLAGVGGSVQVVVVGEVT